MSAPQTSDRTIGIITHNFESPFHTPLIDAIRDEAHKHQIGIFSFFGTVQEIAALKLAYNAVDGWIELARPAQVELLLESGKPVVVISGLNPHVDCITPDNTSGARAAVQHLIDLGHRRIAFMGNADNFDFGVRGAAYQSTLEAAGITVDPALMINATGYVAAHGSQAMQQLMARGVEFSAIFVASDWLAIGVMEYIQAQGLRVPEDIAVIGFDDMLQARLMKPPISSIRPPLVELGVRAVQLLVERMAQAPNERTPQTILMPTTMFARGSTVATSQSAAPTQEFLAQREHDLNLLLTTSIFYQEMVDRDYAVVQQINHQTDPFAITWLSALDSDWGLLAVRQDTEHPTLAPHERLRIVSTYTRAQGAVPANREVALADFPPRDWIRAATQERTNEVLKMFPLIDTSSRHWGFLIFSERPFRTEIDTTRQRQEYITSAFERAVRQQRIEAAYQRERALSDTVRELGCPMIPLLPGVILVPLIGTIDDRRAGQIIETILDGIGREQASQVLLDITGVPVIDTHVAAALLRTAQAAGLLGARTTLVGVRPEIAQSMVGLGINLGAITTCPTLAAALRELLRQG